MIIGAITTLLVATGMQGLAEHTAAATPNTLETIPAVQRWLPGGPGFTLGDKSKIVYFDAALADTARRFGADLTSATGHAVVPVAGGTSAPGDIELRVGAVAGSAPSSDAFSVTVSEKLILVGATLDGARYGTSTAEQLLRRSPTIPGGTAVDWPTYRERGLMLDVGRKYLSIPWIRAQIRRMAYLKMNYLHLHLSDEFGFRLESSVHPEIVASQHYSKQEIRDLVAYATSYGVQIVPEIDMPGHMHTVLAAHPELQLRNARGEAAAGALDLSNPRTYDLMRDLLEEFIPLFPSSFWHIGADEFLPYLTDYTDYPQLGMYARARHGPGAQPRDALFGFVNWADEIVRSHGKTTRMWNDGYVRGDSAVAVNRDIVVEHWSAGAVIPFFGNAYTAAELVALGHEVQNAAGAPTYYTTGPIGWVTNEPPALAYQRWDPSIFVAGDRLSRAANVRNRGSVLHLWCNDPTVPEDQLAVAITEPLWVMAQKAWGSAGPATYPEYLYSAQQFGNPIGQESR